MKYEKDHYVVEYAFIYKSKRFNRALYIEKGFKPNGASGIAIDIHSKSWVIHDKACSTWKWMDGSKLSNWQASWIIYDVLKSEHRWFRKYTWFIATLLFTKPKIWLDKIRNKV